MPQKLDLLRVYQAWRFIRMGRPDDGDRPTADRPARPATTRPRAAS